MFILFILCLQYENKLPKFIVEIIKMPLKNEIL